MALNETTDGGAPFPWDFAPTGKIDEHLSRDEAREEIRRWADAVTRDDREAATRSLAQLARAGLFRPPGAMTPQPRSAAPVSETSEPARRRPSKRQEAEAAPAPKAAVELHAETRALAFVPLPTLAVPAEVLRKANVAAIPTPWGELPALAMDEVAAAWVGGLLGQLRNLADAVTAQRARLKTAIDDAADRATVRIAGLRAVLDEAYGAELKAWTAANCRGKRRHVDLLSIRLQLRASGGDPEWIANPNEERALMEFAEEHAGLDYVRREPRLDRTRFKAWLKDHSVRAGTGGRALVDLVDEATGEVTEVVVPGVRIALREDVLDVKATGAALAAPESTED